MKADELNYHPLPGRKVPVIALIGSDGSGKSTVSAALLETMTEYHPTLLCHLGKQAGNLGRSLQRLPIIGQSLGKKTKKEDKKRQDGQEAGLLVVCVTFALSMRRVFRFGLMRHKHRKGLAILADRYPQNTVPGPMDGPSLPDMVLPKQKIKNLVARILMQWELSLYTKMSHFPPDLVIRLLVDIETALQRKPDHLKHRLERKIADNAKLAFGKTPIMNIDATAPLEVVLDQARRAVRQVCATYPSQRRGILIALVGCDGSGKSSLSADLVHSLAPRHPMRYHYLGLGSGDLGRAIGRWPIIGPILEKRLTRKAKKARTKGEKIPGFITAYVLFAFSLLRYRRFLRMKDSVNKGYFVITDRYPQAEIAGQCDGPGLGAAHSHNPLILLLTHLEKRLYHKMAAFHPDLVILLDVDARTAHDRKPDHDLEALRIKTEIMPQLHYDQARRAVINATKTYPEVKQAVLDLLRQKKLLS